MGLIGNSTAARAEPAFLERSSGHLRARDSQPSAHVGDIRPDGVDEGAIRAEQIQAIMRNTPMAMLANVVNSALIVAGTWGVLPRTEMLVWMAAIWLLALHFFATWYRRRNRPLTRVSRDILYRARLFVFVLAVPWAWLGARHLGSASTDVDLLIITVICGMTCGGALSLTRDKTAAVIYIATLLIPTLAKVITVQSSVFWVLTGLTMMYGAFLVVAVYQSAALTRERAVAQQAIANQREVISLLLRDFEKSTSDWLWETDMQHRLTYSSAKLEHVTRMDADALEGQPISRWAADNADSQMAWVSLMDRLENGLAINDARLPVDIGGQRRWWSLTAKPRHDLKGEVIGYRGIGKDITAEHEALALREAKNEAERSNAAKSRFLAVMSHELRTPLNAVIGFAEIIAKEHFGPVAPARYRECAHDILESSQHLLSLINDVLDIARIENRTLEIERLAFSLPELVGSVMRIAEPLAGKAGVTLEQLPDGGPGTALELDIEGDYRLLKQLLINLVGNAIKFTPAGGHVAVDPAVNANGELEIAVRDTGIGIAEDEINTVFEAFTQADSGHDRRQAGVGLGLTIAKHIAEAHGGRIRLESVQGEGSTLTLVLPPDCILEAVATPGEASLAGASPAIANG